MAERLQWRREARVITRDALGWPEPWPRGGRPVLRSGEWDPIKEKSPKPGAPQLTWNFNVQELRSERLTGQKSRGEIHSVLDKKKVDLVSKITKVIIRVKQKLFKMSFKLCIFLATSISIVFGFDLGPSMRIAQCRSLCLRRHNEVKDCKESPNCHMVRTSIILLFFFSISNYSFVSSTGSRRVTYPNRVKC